MKLAQDDAVYINMRKQLDAREKAAKHAKVRKKTTQTPGEVSIHCLTSLLTYLSLPLKPLANPFFIVNIFLTADYVEPSALNLHTEIKFQLYAPYR